MIDIVKDKRFYFLLIASVLGIISIYLYSLCCTNVFFGNVDSDPEFTLRSTLKTGLLFLFFSSVIIFLGIKAADNLGLQIFSSKKGITKAILYGVVLMVIALALQYLFGNFSSGTAKKLEITFFQSLLMMLLLPLLSSTL